MTEICKKSLNFKLWFFVFRSKFFVVSINSPALSEAAVYSQGNLYEADAP